MTAGLIDLLRAFEPPTWSMKSCLELFIAGGMTDPTPMAVSASVPDNLLLVTTWLEYNVGHTIFVNVRLKLKYYQ